MYLAVSNGYFDAHGSRGGSGSATFTVDTTTPATAPGAPTGLAVTPGNANLELSWTAPLGAAALVVLHQHPSNDPTPSR